MQKFICTLFLVLIAVTSWAYDAEIDCIYYNLNSSAKTAEVTGTYYFYFGNIIIPESVTYNEVTYSVTSIGDNAFYDRSGLTSINIPNSVTSIGNYAFYGCSGLTSVTIPNSVTSIGEGAFNGCSNMSELIYNAKNATVSTNIYSLSFPTTLTNVTIGSEVESIPSYFIYGNTGVTSISIPNSVTSIENNAFDGCSGLTSINIPESVTRIEDYTFYGCTGLTSITIPSSVTSIGNNAFDGCSGLTSVTIPSSVTSIGNYAFYGCSGLTSITIPNSVTSIGENAFNGCSNMSELIYNAKNATVSISTSFYLTLPFPQSLTKVTIGNEVESIPSYFIYGNIGVTSISIPNSVTSIGSYAFYGCSGLTSINIPESVTSIGAGAFYGCTGLTSVAIPNSVTSIERGAFYECTGLTSVTIPNSVTSIGECAFYECTGLKSVTIPSSVTSIGGSAFYGCTGLKEVYSKSPTPPTATTSTFENVKVNYCKLYVPIGSKESYQWADGWADFVNINEMNFDEGSEDVEAPVISYEEGKLKFNSSETDAQYLYTLKVSDVQSTITPVDGGEVSLAACYDIVAYTKTSKGTSLASTAQLCWITGKLITEGVESPIGAKRAVLISSNDGVLTISGLGEDETASIYSSDGKLLGTTTCQFATNANQVVIVKIGNDTIKTVVK